jgi:uncharacterized membrane-anchored protein YitT (DUF2179 family)
MFKNKLSKKDILIAIKNIFLVIIGTVILAFGTGVFLFPFQIVTGGISGLAIILDDIYAFEMGSLKSYDIYVFVITWGLFILGLFILGKNFAIKTLVSTIVYSPIFSLSVRLVENNVFNGFFNIAEQYPELGVLLGAVFGGAPLIEAIFNYPGFGAQFNSFIGNRDYFMIQGMMVFMSFMIISMEIIRATARQILIFR